MVRFCTFSILYSILEISFAWGWPAFSVPFTALRIVLIFGLIEALLVARFRLAAHVLTALGVADALSHEPRRSYDSRTHHCEQKVCLSPMRVLFRPCIGFHIQSASKVWREFRPVTAQQSTSSIASLMKESKGSASADIMTFDPYWNGGSDKG